jgi:hypothetical protein
LFRQDVLDRGTQKTSPAMHKTAAWEEEKEKKKIRKEKKRKQ